MSGVSKVLGPVAIVAITACAHSSSTSRPVSDAPGASSPALILARPGLLAETRELIRKGDGHVSGAFASLARSADSARRMRPLSVMQKQTVPPSGDKHDYLSMAPYWWPDSTKPNGLPYIRRDGEMNPQTRIDHDGLRFGAMVNAVEALALAYWIRGTDDDADKAATLVRAWFLDPATRMNANLRFAQAILGISEGRGIGILDLRAFPRLLDALALIRSSGKFSASDEAAFKAWCSAYLDWLINSSNGKDERSQPNNHGTLYDAQAASIALYLGRTDLARQLIWDDGRKRVDAQIRGDGSQPLELERTRPVHYSLFNLDAYTQLAEMGRHVGVDLWHYRNPAGGSILSALRFIAPYATGERTWTKPDIASIEPEERSIALRRAGTVLQDTLFANAAIRSAGVNGSILRERLFYPGSLPRSDSVLSNALEFAKEQLLVAATSLDPGKGFPRSTLASGQWDQRPYNQWTSGFFAGALWEMYAIDETPQFRTLAEKWSRGLEPARSITTTHDLGFMVYKSVGYRAAVEHDTASMNVVLDASRNLAARYNLKVGAIKSWDTYGGSDARREWKFPVIIDNLMNLEMLFRVAAWGHPEYKQIAERHALTSARVHVRPDGSTAHVALFDPETGRLERTVTWQGWSDSSVWARGQAWAIHGFASSYGFTRNRELLTAAERTADWFIDHMPADGIPWWDFRDPRIPNAERDASAAAIAASGLLDLSRRTSGERAAKYHAAAELILHTLARHYLTTDMHMASILAHSVGGRPQNTEVDVGLIYADYYFIEALARERGIFFP